MAHQPPIARWVLNNREGLKPSFVKFDWPARYFNRISDFASAISVGGIEVSGRGIDFDQDLALEKSAAEAIERYICKSLNIDSIGVAVSGASGAALHAEQEALERYFFAEHRTLRRPFLRIDNGAAEFPIIGEIQGEFERHNGNAGKLTFFKMATPRPYCGYVATISKNGSTDFLGLSLGVDPRRAIPRAFLEAMANFARFRDEPMNFESEQKESPDSWNSDPGFLSTLTALFESAAENDAPISMPHLVSKPIDISALGALTGCPIAPVKVVAKREVTP